MTELSAAQLVSAQRAVAAYVRAPVAFERIGGSLDRAVVYAVDDRAVLKCYFHAAESKWARETRAYAFLAGRGAPVPERLGCGHLDDETPWLLLARAPGVTAVDARPRLDAAQRVALSQAMGAALAAFHALPIDDRLAGEPVADAEREYFPRLFAKLAAYAARATARATPRAEVLERVARWVAEAAREGHDPIRLRFTHGDFSARNVLVVGTGTQWHLSSVFDFEKAGALDPALDAATVLLADLDWQGPEVRALWQSYTQRADDAPTRDRVRLHAFGIILDAALWAPQVDPAYYHRLLDAAESMLAAPERMPT